MGGVQLTYLEQLAQVFGASEIWPLVDIASGTPIAFISSARNGTLTGWDLQNGAGPVAGTLAPYSDGVNDYGNIYSASLASIFNGQEGSAMIWVKTNDWTEVNQYGFVLLADGNNYIRLFIDSANRIDFAYKAGAVAKERYKSSVTESGWMCWGLSWSKTADEVKAFYNGVQEGATFNSLGTWAGALASARIGAYIADLPGTSLDGFVAYCAFKFGSVWTPAQFLAMYLAANP